jgi:pimeloyl-ACP methyl ester carboxylesterase
VGGAAPPELPGVAHRWVRAGELDVHIAEAGDGPPLVLLHGWPQHWWCWRHVIPALAPRYRVLAADLRGLGWTSAPRGGYDKRQLARDLIELLDALELERVVLAGHDWGGWAGFIACAHEPQRFERFVALGIPPPWQRANAASIAALPALAYQPLVAGPLGPRLQAAGGQRFLRLVYRAGAGHGWRWTEEELAPYLERFRDPDVARAGACYYRSFLLREMPALVRGRYLRRRLSVPTLLLVGERDPVGGRSGLLRGVARHADDIRIEIVEGAGHWLPEERPAVVAQAIAGDGG